MSRKDEVMRVLGITEDEYNTMLADDKRIDRGEKLFSLSPELEAGAKKARQADRKSSVANRERKQDADKRLLIDTLVKAIGEDVVTVQNPEREFLFTFNEKLYKVVLSCPRK